MNIPFVLQYIFHVETLLIHEHVPLKIENK